MEDYNSLEEESDLAEGAPVAVPIAGGALGSQIFLFTSDHTASGIKTGAVYFWDCENRSAWSDEVFYRQFPNLASDIERYLELRRDGKLPDKGEALRDFYRIADSFTLFLESCLPWNIGDDGEDSE